VAVKNLRSDSPTSTLRFVTLRAPGIASFSSATMAAAAGGFYDTSASLLRYALGTDRRAFQGSH
jgi:hypothetical protein